MRVTTHIGEDGDRWWTIVGSPDDPRPLARGTVGYPDIDSCARAAERAMAAEPAARKPVRQPDGGWRWVITDPTGQPIAESPDVFTNPAFCGYALYELRHAIQRGALVDESPPPVVS